MADQKPLILIVDDEPDMLFLYSTKLKRGGFDVVTAENGAQGIALAKEKHPALILMDVKMPGMNGIEAFSELQKDPATQDIKVVFLTAFGDPGNSKIDGKFAKGVGAMDFLKKGSQDIADFETKIRGYLGLEDDPAAK